MDALDSSRGIGMGWGCGVGLVGGSAKLARMTFSAQGLSGGIGLGVMEAWRSLIFVDVTGEE